MTISWHGDRVVLHRIVSLICPKCQDKMFGIEEEEEEMTEEDLYFANLSPEELEEYLKNL